MYPLEKYDETFVGAAPCRFLHSISCALPPEGVFDLLVNSDLESEWFPDFVSAEWLTPPPQGVGSLRLYRLKYMTLLEEFLIWERGRRLVFRLNGCTLPILRGFVENYLLAPRAGGGTDLVWEVCYRPNPWLRFLHPVVRPFFSRDFSRAAQQLQALLEKIGRRGV